MVNMFSESEYESPMARISVNLCKKRKEDKTYMKEKHYFCKKHEKILHELL